MTMSNNYIWVVRAGKNAAYVDDFVEKNFVAIGFSSVGEIQLPINKKQLEKQIHEYDDSLSPGKVGNIASQVKRFYEDFKINDNVLVYDPSQRLYFLGEIKSEVESTDHELSRARKVNWVKQVDRDSLEQTTRNKLGAILTLFQLKGDAVQDIWSNAIDIGAEVVEKEKVRVERRPSQIDNSAEEIESQAFELIDDQIAALDWENMQDLVAEILEAMGFATVTSARGPDRGVDITASPDGLGLKEPRIFVEVKHRIGTRISADLIRAFIGGRQAGDKCLYVSTGGFTKEAKYEAERSSVPLTLIDLPKLRSLVLEHYESFSPEGLALVKLKRIYWPLA